MIATEHEHRRSFATSNESDGDHHISPATEVVRIGNLEKALLLAGLVEIEGSYDPGEKL
jgi:hypothetical protein